MIPSCGNKPNNPQRLANVAAVGAGTHARLLIISIIIRPYEKKSDSWYSVTQDHGILSKMALNSGQTFKK